MVTERAIDNTTVKAFVKAGNALFTLENSLTGNRFTFKVKRSDDETREVYFVSVLAGPNNTQDYSYLGCIFGDTFKRTAKSRIGEDAMSYKAFKWFMSRLENLPECIKVYHHGRCARCARVLTVPSSIESGFGPECASKLGI